VLSGLLTRVEIAPHPHEVGIGPYPTDTLCSGAPPAPR
jgi:hypothetical protein